MKYIKTWLMSLLITALFISGMAVSVSADEDSVTEESPFAEESPVPADSSEPESSIDQSSEPESSIDQSSGTESSTEQSSETESSTEQSSGAESSDEESDDRESSNEESGKKHRDQNSSPESSAAVQPKPKNDPLRWMADIKVILPADRENGSAGQTGGEEVSYILPPAEPEDDEEKFADLSTVPAEPIDEIPAAVTVPEGTDRKTQFLVGIIIFSALGMALTFGMILFLRSKKETNTVLRKKKNK